MEIKTSILISSSPEKVWAVLTDFASYKDWNPFVKSLTGEVAKGNKIHVVLPGMTFTPRVLEYSANREFRWLGHLWIPGLFDGEHYFLLHDNGNGTTIFNHGEIFKGILVPLFKKSLMTKTKSGFEKMNQKLKERCEKKEH